MTREEIPWEVGDPAVVRCDDPNFDGREGVVARVSGGRVLVHFDPPAAYDAEMHELDSPRPPPPTNRRRLPLPPGRAGAGAAVPTGPGGHAGPRTLPDPPPGSSAAGG